MDTKELNTWYTPRCSILDCVECMLPSGLFQLCGMNTTFQNPTAAANASGSSSALVAPSTAQYGALGLGSATTGASLFWNFTGQHRCFVTNFNSITMKQIEGLIVCANNNKYISDISTNFMTNDTSGALTTIDAMPMVSLCTASNDKSVFGVVCLKTEYPPGMNPTPAQIEACLEQGDVRAEINAMGDGSMWVSDFNGPVATGDYITSSSIPGYGQVQNDDFLHSYTVGKSTIDCDFSCPLVPQTKVRKDVYGNNILDANGWPIWDVIMVPTDIVDPSYNLNVEMVPSMVPVYNMRYLLIDGTQITLEEYNAHLVRQDVQVHRAAFLGVTYHCG